MKHKARKFDHAIPERQVRGNSWEIYRRIMQFVIPHWRLGVVAIVFMILAAGAQAAFAWIIQPLIDGTFIERDPQARIWVPAAILGIFILHGLTMFASDYSVAHVGKKVVTAVRQATYEKYLSLPMRYFDTASPGILVAKLTYNVNAIANAASQAVVVLIRDSFTVAFLFAYMIYLSTWMTLITLTLGPGLFAIILAANRRFRKTSKRMQDSVGQFAQVAEDSIRGHAEIKVFGARERESERFLRINEKHRRQQMKYVAAKAMAQPLVQLLAVIALSTVLYLASSDRVLQHLTPGGLLSFITAMLLLMPSLKRIVTVNSQIQQALAASESVFEILDTPSEEDHGQRSIDRARGDLKFEQVSFGYDPEKPVLRNIDIEIPAGRTLALVGQSGSGKSSLVKLIPRFYSPQKGRILLDGHPVEEYRLDDLRAQIALVSQQVTLFNDTLANNIRYGARGDISREDLERVARDANALEFIEKLPQGFDTIIGEDGVMLSGGQRQRIAIARALIKDAPILILDEATSALDSRTESLIQEALERLMKNRTTIVIAHRLSTIENADRIIVMEAGAVVESGSHRYLLARNGAYASFHRLQASGQDAS